MRAQAVAVISSLRRDEGGLERFIRSLAEAHVTGVEVDWTALLGAGAGSGSRFRPTRSSGVATGWRRAGASRTLRRWGSPRPSTRCWAAAPAGRRRRVRVDRTAVARRPLLARRPRGDGQGRGAGRHVPGAGVARRCGDRRAGRRGADDVGPLVLEARSPVALQVSVSRAGQRGRREVAIYSRLETPDEPDAEWTRHAAGTLIREPHSDEPPALVWPADGDERDPEIAYANLAEAGYTWARPSGVWSARWATATPCTPRRPSARTPRGRTASSCTRRCWRPPCRDGVRRR